MRKASRFLVLALVVAGCARPSLVGEWRGQQTHDGLLGQAHLSLKDDAKFRMTVNLTTTDNMPGRSRQVTSGSYKANGNTLSLTVESMSVDGIAMEIPPGNNTTRVRYRVKGDTLTIELGKDNRLMLHRA